MSEKQIQRFLERYKFDGFVREAMKVALETEKGRNAFDAFVDSVLSEDMSDFKNSKIPLIVESLREMERHGLLSGSEKLSLVVKKLEYYMGHTC